MSEISRIPQGILGFLGIKNGGRNPRYLVDQLAPTWDMTSLYLENAAQYQSTVSTLNATGYLALFSAPPGELWLVTDYSVDLATGAGEAWQGVLSRATANNLAQVRLADDRTFGASAWGAMVAPRNLYLAPGESLGISTDSVTGPVDYVSQIRYVILQA